jgi:outer membrane protein TolC
MAACAFASAGAAETTGSLTLGQAIGEADQNSPQVQKAHAAYEESSWKRVESYSGFLPKISASGSYLMDKNYVLFNVPGFPGAIPQIIPTTVYTLDAELPLFDGFASTNRYRSASSFEKSAQSEYEWAKFTVSREVALQFYKALGAKVLKDVADQNVQTLQDHLKDVNLFKKAGVSTNYDVLRVEVQVSEAKSEQLSAIDNVEITRNKLGEILGKDAETREPLGQMPVLNADLIKDLSGESIYERGDLKALNQKTEGFDYQESAAGRYLVPRISAFGQYQYYNNLNDRFDDHDAFRDAYQVGIMFTWNLFDGMTSVARSKESVQQKYQIDKSLQIARIKAKQDFDVWKRKYIYYCTLYKSRLDDIARSKESVRLAREGRRVGARTNTELLDAESDLHRAEAGAVNAQIGAVEALINLELTVGKKIYDFN